MSKKYFMQRAYYRMRPDFLNTQYYLRIEKGREHTYIEGKGGYERKVRIRRRKGTNQGRTSTLCPRSILYSEHTKELDQTFWTHSITYV